jgi:Ca-activated chloride channel family protein
MATIDGHIWILGLALALGMAWISEGRAQPLEVEEERTLSPYFLVQGDDPELDQLPLESTAVKAQIAGVIAAVQVVQVYKNEGSRALEAIYIFPASTRAAVYGLQMKIGDRTIVAQVRQREAARQEYEQAREEGRSASLLEQQRPNVFQMNVANIMPGDVVTVELHYTELLVPSEGVYEFVYPAVVGPRYSNQPAESAPENDRWIANPYLHEGEPSPYTFDVEVELNGGVPIQDLTCATHEVVVGYQNKQQAVAKLGKGPGSGGDRDFILRYRLQGQQIQSGLLLHEGEDENYFLLTVQPPARVQQQDIPPREFIFVLDISGSMNGFPLDTAKHLMRQLLEKLRPIDRFNLLFFAGGSQLLARESLAATAAHLEQALEMVDHARGGGGTELLPALRRAMDLPRDEEVARTLLVITDGFVGVEKQTFELIRQNLGQANLFAFGIGSSVNRLLIEGMARAGMGEPFVVTGAAEAAAKSAQFQRYVATPVLSRVELDFGDFEAYDVVPQQLPDVLAERPVTVFGKWRGRPQGTIRLQGRQGAKIHRAEVEVAAADSAANGALRYLWARHSIAELSDYVRIGGGEEKERITQLGLRYNLLTDYTSFGGVDRQVRRDGSEVLATVRQPLPLPAGVGDQAVGGSRMMARMAPMQKGVFGAVNLMIESLPVKQSEESLQIDLEVDEEPRLESIEIEVSAGLEALQVQSVLERGLRSLERFLSGREIELLFEIDASGHLESFEVLSGGMADGLEVRIEETLAAIRFPQPAGGHKVRVRYEFKVG